MTAPVYFYVIFPCIYTFMLSSLAFIEPLVQLLIIMISLVFSFATSSHEVDNCRFLHLFIHLYYLHYILSLYSDKIANIVPSVHRNKRFRDLFADLLFHHVKLLI